MINTAVKRKIDCDYLLHVRSHSCLIATSLPSVALGIPRININDNTDDPRRTSPSRPSACLSSRASASNGFLPTVSRLTAHGTPALHRTDHQPQTREVSTIDFRFASCAARQRRRRCFRPDVA